MGKYKKDGLTASQRRAAKQKAMDHKPFYTVRSIFGYQDVHFFLLLGGRETGKSYSVMDRFIRDFKTKDIPFYWLRLTDRLAETMLQNNAAKFVDADLVRKYNLDLTVEGCEVFDHGKKMAEIRGISTFYNQKGTASFDNEWKKGYNICLYECQREVGEPNRFDISYALVNTLENYVRSTKKKLKIVFICNYTETCSDILNLFNFIPERFGRYHLAAKKAVLDYIAPNSAYLERRKETVADILMPDASTFTNKVELDKTLLYKGKRYSPTVVLNFGAKDEVYTIWDSNIIAPYKGEKKPTYGMKPYVMGCIYDAAFAKKIINLFDNRGFKFIDLITQQRFTASLGKIRKGK